MSFTWKQDEIENHSSLDKLLELVREHGENWAVISKIIDRDPDFIKDRYLKFVNRYWSSQELDQLKSLYEIYGDNVQAIMQHLPNRRPTTISNKIRQLINGNPPRTPVPKSPNQVTKRILKYPNLWNKHDDAKLIALCRQYQNDWTKISEKFPNKSVSIIYQHEVQYLQLKLAEISKQDLQYYKSFSPNVVSTQIQPSRIQVKKRNKNQKTNPPIIIIDDVYKIEEQSEPEEFQVSSNNNILNMSWKEKEQNIQTHKTSQNVIKIESNQQVQNDVQGLNSILVTDPQINLKFEDVNRDDDCFEIQNNNLSKKKAKTKLVDKAVQTLPMPLMPCPSCYAQYYLNVTHHMFNNLGQQPIRRR